VDLTDIVTLVFLIGGVGLMLAELALPGLVSIFIGAGAVLTAALRFLGVVDGIPESMIVWMISSVVMVIALRNTAKKYFPADESRGEIDEDLEAFGEVVDIVEEVPEFGEDVEPGRIRFDGTTWPAYSTGGALPVGGQGRLVYRKNLAWFIEPANTLADGEEEPVPEAVSQEVKKEG
jgi:membrane protein implicated in regulation of membrane protease activity